MYDRNDTRFTVRQSPAGPPRLEIVEDDNASVASRHSDDDTESVQAQRQREERVEAIPPGGPVLRREDFVAVADDQEDEDEDLGGSVDSDKGTEERDDPERCCEVCERRLDDSGYGIDEDTEEKKTETGGKRRREWFPCAECCRPKKRRMTR